MRVPTICGVIFRRIDFMAIIFLTTGNKNLSNLVTVPAIDCT